MFERVIVPLSCPVYPDNERWKKPTTHIKLVSVSGITEGGAHQEEVAFDERDNEGVAIRHHDLCVAVADIPALILGLRKVMAGPLGRLALEAENEPNDVDT